MKRAVGQDLGRRVWAAVSRHYSTGKTFFGGYIGRRVRVSRHVTAMLTRPWPFDTAGKPR